MSSNTTNLNLYKKDPVTDGNDFFDIATMLNNNWDKVDTAVATKAPLASPAFTGNPTAPTPSPNDNDTTIATTAFVMGQIGIPIAYGTTSGTNTYTVTPTPSLVSYVDGSAVSIKIGTTNTSAATINVNGLGAKNILDSKGNTMTAGKLRAGSIYTMRYNGTDFILQGEGATGNAAASDLLSGKTASTDAGDITGTMPNNGALNYTPSPNAQTIPAGYTTGGSVAGVVVPAANVLVGTTIAGTVGTMPNNGTINKTPSSVNQSIPAGYTTGGTVYGDSKLTAGNIASDTTIFGVTGTLPRQVWLSAPTYRTYQDPSLNWFKMKSITVSISLTVTLSITLVSALNNGVGVNMYFAKNGAMIGSVYTTTSGSGINISGVHVDVNAGDVIEVWARPESFSGAVGVRDFLITNVTTSPTNGTVNQD